MATLRIPDHWLQGFCLRLEREGVDPREAIRQAVAFWKEQDRLEALFLQQQQAN